MFSRRSLIGLGLLLSAAADALGKEPAGAEALDPASGHLFSGAAALGLAGTLVRREDLGGTWDPSREEISQLEGALAQELSSRLRAHPASGDLDFKVRNYYRQYAGIYLKGQKLILINGFYRSHVEYTTAWLAQPHSEAELAAFPPDARNKDYWHFVPVVVLEGGERYFDGFYDPAHHRIMGFAFHSYG